MEAKELAWGFESPFILTLSTFTGAHLLCTFTTADADVFARAGCGNKGLIELLSCYLLFFFFSYRKEIRKEAKEKEKIKLNRGLVSEFLEVLTKKPLNERLFVL